MFARRNLSKNLEEKFKGCTRFQRRNSGGHSGGGLENFRGDVPTKDEDEKVKTRLQRRNSQKNSEEEFIPGGN